MENQPFISVPWYDGDTRTWKHKDFENREQFKAFVISCFKEPGKYEFDEVSNEFNAQARRFNTFGYYCYAPFKSKDYITFWDTQKERCMKGAIFTNKGKTWYLTRDYYMWLNFLPIYDKEEKKYGFAKIRDAQYHMAIFENLAELHYQHVVILKKRQIASSYFHAGKLINGFWFDSGFIGKMGASLKDYINEKGTWQFLDEYASFLDTHTAWYRPRTPNKIFAWEQKIETKNNGRTATRGLKSRMLGMSFEKNPTNGVGGPVSIFFHEEGGIAPKADLTYEYIRPALSSGMTTTGIFILAGSVGDLDQCDPLKKYLLNPVGNGFYGVETNLLDEHGKTGICGLFIPEQWSMPPYIDQYGNSLVEEAVAAIIAERKQWKIDLEPQEYQLRISQKPMNIEEAFAIRSVSKFPTHILQGQLTRIKDKEYPFEYLDFERNEQGKVEVKKSKKIPITTFPVDPKLENKESVPVIYERPTPNAPWGTYIASVDPVGEGKTTTSESLCSINIYKTAVEVTVIDDVEGPKTHFEGDKLVATWCGRYDDLNKTHELLELMIEWYNAWTLVEANVSLFINHMIIQKKQKYLVPKDQVAFLKELASKQQSFNEYGWKNTGTFFKEHLLNYMIEFVKEVIYEEFDKDGKSIKKVYGVTRIPDPLVIIEMIKYHDKLNVDRLVSLTALVAFAKVLVANRGYRKIVEHTSKSLEKSKDLYKLKVNPYRNLERSSPTGGPRKERSAFKNLGRRR